MRTLVDGIHLLARHGGVVEARLLQTRRATVSGYFDAAHLEQLVAAVTPWDGTTSIYITANPVAPALLARAHNRLRDYAHATTADADILRRVWFLTDFDPVRPKGISATDAELQAALGRRDDAVAFLRELGFPAPIEAMSGNGAHALWPIDLPNDAAATALLQAALKALAAKFSDPVVAVDPAVFNAARIWKLYGTVAVKGDATAERPHRRAALERVPEALLPLDPELLRVLAAMAAPPRTTRAARRSGALTPLDLVGDFQARGWYTRALDGGKHAVTCPWASAHSGDSGVTETCLFDPRGDGEPWGFDCKHQHCVDRTITDVLGVLGLSRNGHHGADDAVAAVVTASHPPRSIPPRGDESDPFFTPEEKARFVANVGTGTGPGATPAGDALAIWADGAALYQRPVRPVAHLVEGIVAAAGAGVITGEDKAGKSTVALLLALSYMHGVPFLGRAIPRPGRVCLVSEEDDADELRDRLRALHVGLARAYPAAVSPPDDAESLALVADRLVWEAREGWRFDAPDLFDSLVGQIIALRDRDPEGPPVLLLLDSLQAVRGLADPTKPEGVALVKLALRQLAAAGAVVLLVAHARKVVSGGKRTARASQEVAASHELVADVAFTLGLMSLGPRADAPVRLDLVTKRGRSGVLGALQITYAPEDVWPPGVITVALVDPTAASAATDARIVATDTAVLDALPALAPGTFVRAIVAATKLSDKTVRQALERLKTAERCFVTDVTTKSAKLYARIVNAVA